MRNKALRQLVPLQQRELKKTLAIKGLLAMLMASSFFSLMSVSVYLGSQLAHPVDALVMSFIRVSVNLALLLLPSLILGNTRLLWGDMRGSLWLRGLFGGISLILSFSSIQRIGPGESSFLTATSGVFVLALSPAFLGQKNAWYDWLAILGALLGLYFLVDPQMDTSDLPGRLLGVASGFIAALAYLMIARSGQTNPSRSIVFYFSFVAFLLHLLWFMLDPHPIPSGREAWGLAFLTGLSGSLAQAFMTRAYQLAPAALVSAIGYSVPVLNLGLSVWLLDKVPNHQALLGCLLILITGIGLPFLSAGKKRFG
jgi:S-adenosylmethionine uptake transporter